MHYPLISYRISLKLILHLSRDVLIIRTWQKTNTDDFKSGEHRPLFSGHVNGSASKHILKRTLLHPSLLRLAH